jgi:hypothetical protein
MRKRFGNWGAGLSEGDFACALAAAGTLADWMHVRRLATAPEPLAAAIERRLAPSRTLPWRLPPIPPQIGAALLLAAWRMFLDTVGPRRFWIEVEPETGDWLMEQLRRPEVGAAIVRIARDPTRGEESLGRTETYSVGAEPPTDPGYGATGGDEGYRSAYGYGMEVAERSRSRRWDNLEANIRYSWETRPYEVREAMREGFERVMDERREQAPPRWLQAQLRSGARDVKTLRGTGSYEAVIRIGKADAQWVAVQQPFPAPEEPPAPEGHWLTVIFWEPRVSPDPQVRPLLLPPEGNTEEIAFAFEVPAGLDRIAARVTVLHANRVLQTGLLRASVGSRKPWTFTLDATPRTRLEGLSARSEFDVALVLNHDDEGTAQMTAVSGDQAAVINLSESSVDALTRELGNQISAIAANPKRYESLESEGTEELLRILAQHGGDLHRRLCGYNPLAKLDQADAEGRQGRLHLTSAKPDTFFPVELVYRYEAPEDTARLCQHALTALSDGSCPASCPSDKSETICPLGFWGLCRVVERHSYLVQPEKPADGFRLKPEPVLLRSPLDVSGKALLAASDAASEVQDDAVESLLRTLRQRGPAERASTWQEWSERVKTDRPTLLVLLPHHERRDGFEILEIGADEELKSSLIKKKHVRADDKDRPIVLLMGCDTNLARIAFESFVGGFILEGAAIVVSTIATILGRHASPATARLVELLDEEAREGNSSFGEVMMRLRRKLLAEATPMALGLTAYGDADWILTRQG